MSNTDKLSSQSHVEQSKLELTPFFRDIYRQMKSQKEKFYLTDEKAKRKVIFDR